MWGIQMNLNKLDTPHRELVEMILRGGFPISLIYPGTSSYHRRKIYYILEAIKADMENQGVKWEAPSIKSTPLEDGNTMLIIYKKEFPSFTVVDRGPEESTELELEPGGVFEEVEI